MMDSKTLTPGPKTRVCYVCGRQYGLHSYDIHLKQCKELWIAREAQKDPKERKKLPEDPALRLLSGGSVSGENEEDSPTRIVAAIGIEGGLSLAELNKLASETFNTETLSTCAFCGRTFLAEKLAIHNRSCTADNPARRISEGVKKGQPTPAAESFQRPHTTSTGSARKVESRPEPTQTPQGKTNISSSANDDGINMKLEGGHLVGNLGGASGRVLRPSNVVNTEKQSTIPETREFTVAVINQKIAMIESTVFGLMDALNELKVCVQQLQG
jgi:hypothetical protein